MLAALLLNYGLAPLQPPAPPAPAAAPRFGGPVYWRRKLKEKEDPPVEYVRGPEPEPIIFPKLKALPDWSRDKARIDAALKRIEEEDELMQVFLLIED